MDRRSEPSHDALPPGSRLAEYEILSVLGQRGAGIVYLAMDHGLQRQVAIKEYLPATLASRGHGAVVTLRSDGHAETFTRGLEAFVDEARLLARLDHPALARAHRFLEANGTAYMVMPYYEGVTVGAARRAMAHPPDEAWLRELLLPLLGALELLHTVSCYPQDISPETILLRADGRPLLLDVGTACQVIGSGGQAPMVILEPGFVAIEQYAESSDVRRGPWTNLYSLAALAYYCVSGQAPVGATVRAVDDQMEPLFQVVDRLGRSFPDLDYSVAFVSAIERALRVRPQERPQSVAEFRRALQGGRSAAESTAAPSAVEVADPGMEARLHSEREAQRPFFLSPDGHASRGRVNDPDDTVLRKALNAALQPDSDDVRGSPRSEEFPAPDRGRRTAVAGAAAVALLVLGVGAWLMWPQEPDPDLVGSTALTAEPEAEPAPVPLPPPEPPAQTAPVPSEMAAEPQAPQSESVAPAAPSGMLPAEGAPVAEETAVAENQAPGADTPPAEASPPAPPFEEADAPSAPPPEMLVAKEPDNPRELCGSRTHFSLYYCMSSVCERSKYFEHPECQYLRKMDAVRTAP